MEKKIVLLKDLNQAQFPVVDILKSESEERLGCATTAMVNWIMKLGLFNNEEFSNISEMALYWESTFETKDSGVEPKTCFSVIDGYINENKSILETLIFRADSFRLETLLKLLLNDFVGLVCSQTQNDGHCDILFYENGKIYFNAFEIENEEDLAELVFSHPMNMICFGRSLKTHKRFAIKASEMGSLIFSLTEKNKAYLTEKEQYMLSQNMVEVFCKYPTHDVQGLIQEKEYLLKNLGYLDKDLVVIYPQPLK